MWTNYVGLIVHLAFATAAVAGQAIPQAFIASCSDHHYVPVAETSFLLFCLWTLGTGSKLQKYIPVDRRRSQQPNLVVAYSDS